MNPLKLLRTQIGKYILYKFWTLHGLVLKKNKKYENIHKGEKCLIFGNGGSLKLLDFNKLPKYRKIVCTYNLVDKRFNKNNTPDYCIFSYPYGNYPIAWSWLNNNFIINYIGKITKKIIRDNPTVIFFHNLTNYYSYFKKPKNLNFYYNLSRKNNLSYDLSNDFQYDKSALEIMIGTAKYMGFSEAILLGCDYLGHPIGYGHFYSKDKTNYNLKDEFHDGDEQKKFQLRLKKSAGDLIITVVLPNKIISKEFKTISTEEFSNSPEIYQENIDIIKNDYLPLMLKGEEKKVIYMSGDLEKLHGVTLDKWLELKK